MANRKALGRSFSSMLEDNLIETPKGAVQNLPLSDIEPNRGQPRHDFDEAALAALAASISQFGVLIGNIPHCCGRTPLACGESCGAR